MLCDELKEYTNPTYGRSYYDIDEVKAAIAELKDKCQMHDFFWEGCGFAKRGFKNTIAVSEAFDKLEAENAELKKKLMPCLNGDCILTCEVVEKYGKENAELKQKLEDVQASMYCDVVDANMENRRLRRELWIARAERAKTIAKIYSKEAELILLREHYPSGCGFCHIMNNKWRKVERKCRAKAEQYK